MVMYDAKERKRILLAPAGTDKNAACIKGLEMCRYNNYNYCIYCGSRKGHKFKKQKSLNLKKE